MGIFNTKNAEIFERGQYLTPGEYTVDLERLIHKQLQAGGAAVIAEFRIVETNRPDEHPVGSKRTWFVKQNTSFQSNMKEFACAVLGAPSHKADLVARASNFTDEALDMAIDPSKNAFEGRRVKVAVHYVETKTGGQFSAHTWEPVIETAAPEVVIQEIRKVAARAGAGAPPPPPPPPAPGPARVMTPDGRFYLDPATNAWIPVS